MGITPGVLHLNEGHSGFAVLEAIANRMQEEGLTFDQAVPRVSREVVFTTHTPVPAGHDRFNAGLIEEHLGPLRERLGLSDRQLMDLGREISGNEFEEFCMTVLGLKLSRRANAVSALHGEVSRAMWTGLYPGKLEDEVPIGHITNGVHVPTWLAPQMFRLYDRHLGTGWHEHSGESRIWEGIENVDDGELWETHGALKLRLLEFVRRRAVEQAQRRGESPETLQRLSRVLSPDALTIGFARRFATYKRANLILADIEKLASMVNDPKRPVQFVFAGKAHPRDEPGKRVLQQIAELMRDPQFADKFVFVEDYDINVGRLFVQGVDVWLNNPRRPLEASGTSGQKVVLNGGLNLSVLDGWWAEAYDGLNGFAIGTGRTHSNMNVHDTRDGDDLYRDAARRSDSAVLPARPGRSAPRLDQAHEAHHPHAGLALQRQSHGDGLHAEMLRAGGRRHVQRDELARLAAPVCHFARARRLSREQGAHVWQLSISDRDGKSKTASAVDAEALSGAKRSSRANIRWFPTARTSKRSRRAPTSCGCERGSPAWFRRRGLASGGTGAARRKTAPSESPINSTKAPAPCSANSQ